MTRLAEGRSTHLDRSEIAIETLRLFDEGSDPSIRQLAKVLGVTPSAIYHHFDSRAKIVQAAVEIVWYEILGETFNEVGDPFEADPLEFLMVTASVTRRVFSRHYAIAPYLAATPESDELSANTLAIMANIFERLGLTGSAAAEAFHAYASYVFGNSLFAANRLVANAELDRSTVEAGRLERFRTDVEVDAAQRSSPETRAAIDGVIDISMVDPDRDLELFATGLKRLLVSMIPA